MSRNGRTTQRCWPLYESAIARRSRREWFANSHTGSGATAARLARRHTEAPDACSIVLLPGARCCCSCARRLCVVVFPSRAAGAGVASSLTAPDVAVSRPPFVTAPPHQVLYAVRAPRVVSRHLSSQARVRAFVRRGGAALAVVGSWQSSGTLFVERSRRRDAWRAARRQRGAVEGTIVPLPAGHGSGRVLMPFHPTWRAGDRRRRRFRPSRWASGRRERFSSAATFPCATLVCSCSGSPVRRLNRAPDASAAIDITASGGALAAVTREQIQRVLDDTDAGAEVPR